VSTVVASAILLAEANIPRCVISRHVELAELHRAAIFHGNLERNWRYKVPEKRTQGLEEIRTM
jgi:hypothetical protein